MSYLVINGTTFSGLPNGAGNQSAWQPTGYTPKAEKIGVTLVAANGTRNRVERGTAKRTWTLTWDGCNLATMQTVQAIALLGSSFTFSDFAGVTYAVQTEDAADIDWQRNDAAGNSYWSVALTLFQP